jgi:hypothetical protein
MTTPNLIVKDTWREAVAKGVARYRRVIDRVSGADAEYAPMASRYVVDCGDYGNLPDRIPGQLSEYGIGWYNMKWVEVSSTSDDDVAYRNIFSAKCGLAMIDEHYRRHDSNPAESQLYPSEILWQGRKMAAEKAERRLASLKVVLVLVASNKTTMTVVHQANFQSQILWISLERAFLQIWSTLKKGETGSRSSELVAKKSSVFSTCCPCSVKGDKTDACYLGV